LPTNQLVPLLCVTLLLQYLRTLPPVGPVVLGFAIMLGAMCAAARGPDWDVPVLRVFRRPISWLAGISYCLYLVHQQLGYILARALSEDRKSTRLNSSHVKISYAVFCLK